MPTLRSEPIKRRWSGRCIVAATGPSLTPEVAEACRGQHLVAVNDAYRLMPFADVLYACDAAWWKVHNGCPSFEGEKWTSYTASSFDQKSAAVKPYGLRLVAGKFAEGFSLDPAAIHYGSNSGFQAVNLAILFGANPIILVGFDMRLVDRKRHFFGEHPAPLLNTVKFSTCISAFETAAKMLPTDIQIINATPESALKCFPSMSLDDALGTI